MGDIKIESHMADILLLHKMKLNGISEFITKRRDSSGLLNLSCIFLPEDKGVPENSIIRFSTGGTAFPFHNFSKPVLIENLNLYAVSIVLTASHCTTDAISSEDCFRIKECGFSKGRSDFKLMLLKSFINTYTDELISSNCWSYCLPGDISILVLLSRDPHFRPFCFPLGDFSACANGPIPVMICGYPELSDESFKSMYPYPTQNLEKTRNKVNKLFFYGASLVCSEGEGNENGYLLEVACSTYNGMSGSPIISDNKLLGVFCGGYPLPGQREALKIAQQFYKKNIIEAYDALISAFVFDTYYDNQPFKTLANDYDVMLMVYFVYNQLKVIKPNHIQQCDFLASLFTTEDQIKNIIEVGSAVFSTSLIEFLFSAASHYNNKEELMYNVGISIKHPLFREIEQIIERAEKINDLSVNKVLYRMKLIDYIK